jgi:hypothetical protein
MKIFRDPTLALTSALVAGVAVLAGTGAVLAAPSPAPAAVVSRTQASAEVAELRAALPALVRLASGPDAQLFALADDIAVLASSHAEVYGDTPLGRAWLATAEDAAALAGARYQTPSQIHALVARLLTDADLLARVAFDGEGSLSSYGGGSLPALGDPASRLSELDRELPTEPYARRPDPLSTPAGRRLPAPQPRRLQLPPAAPLPSVPSPTDRLDLELELPARTTPGSPDVSPGSTFETPGAPSQVPDSTTPAIEPTTTSPAPAPTHED